MKKEATLIQKVKCLARRARLPKYFNRFGPKDHQMWEFLLCHVVYVKNSRNWRDAEKFMIEYYGISLHWTSWQRAIAKWPMYIWIALARASADHEECLI